MPHVNANAGGALRRNLVVDPDTGEPGVELECCRLMCWAAGQLESRGPRGCCIAWAGDCFYSARQYTFLVEGLPKIFANDHAVKNKLETAALSTMRSVGSTCFPRATLGPVVSATVSVSDHNIVVVVRDDSRTDDAVAAMIRKFKEALPEGTVVDIERIDDVSFGTSSARPVYTRPTPAPAQHAPMNRA